MRSTTIKAIAASLAISLLSAFGAAALDAPSGAAALTLAGARAMALEKSSLLRKAGIAVDATILAQKGDGQAWLPSVTAGAKASLALGPEAGGSASANLNVSQQLWDGGKGVILRSIDALATRAARVSARSVYFSVLETADSAYYAVLAGGEAVDAARSDLAAAEAALALAQAKLEAGIIIRAELLKAQAEEAAAQTALGQAKRAHEAAFARLSSLTGQALPFTLAEVDFASYEALMEGLGGMDDGALEGLVARVSASAVKNNPDLAAAAYAGEKARLAIDEARTAYFPTISASWANGLSWDSGASLYAGSVSISATIPLDFWSTSLAVEEGRLGADTAAAELSEARRNLDLDIRTAVYAWVSAARSVSSSKKAYDYAEGNYESVLESYRLSLASASDLSSSASLVSTNRKAWNSARYDFLAGLSALRTLAGLESDDLLVAMVP